MRVGSGGWSLPDPRFYMKKVSVTQVLGVYADFSKVKPEVLERASQRGTAVHSYCAAYAQKLWVPTVPSDCDGYVISFRKWFDFMVKDVLFVEQRFYHPSYHYGGMPDLGVVLKDGARCLIDNKTPVALQKTWKAQIAGYLELVRANNIPMDKGGSLRLDPNGKMAKLDWYLEEALYFNAFLSALNAYRFFKGGD